MQVSRLSPKLQQIFIGLFLLLCHGSAKKYFPSEVALVDTVAKLALQLSGAATTIFLQTVEINTKESFGVPEEFGTFLKRCRHTSYDPG